MKIDSLNALSALVELLGLLLIALDLYLPRVPDRLRRLADAAVPQPIGGSERQRESYRFTTWIGLYAVVWIAVAGGLSILDPQLGLAANVMLGVLTALVLLQFALLYAARRADMALGRGHMLGSLGLATALVGLAMHLAHAWVSG